MTANSFVAASPNTRQFSLNLSTHPLHILKTMLFKNLRWFSFHYSKLRNLKAMLSVYWLFSFFCHSVLHIIRNSSFIAHPEREPQATGPGSGLRGDPEQLPEPRTGSQSGNGSGLCCRPAPELRAPCAGFLPLAFLIHSQRRARHPKV